MKRVVDDFCDLAIEACVISKLPDLFSPDRVSALDDLQINCIAGESVETMDDRTTLSAKKRVLEECLGELRRLVKHHQHQKRQNQHRLANCE